MLGSIERGAFVGGIVGFGPIDRGRSGRRSLKTVANDGGPAGGEFTRCRPWAMSSSRLPSPTMPPVASTLSNRPAGRSGQRRRRTPVARHVEQRRRGPSDCGDGQVCSTVVPSLNVTRFTRLFEPEADVMPSPDRASTTRAIEMPADCRASTAESRIRSP